MTGESAAPRTGIRLGVSACLLGESVRYDGGHKRDRYVTDVLAEWFEFVPVCPEVGIGMPTPRPPIRLVSTAKGVRALGVNDPGQDVTRPLAAYYSKVADNLAGISGYILKSKSPSCGMERVKLYDEHGQPLQEKSRGRFADRLLSAQPLLPVEEEGRLNDPVLRENFITRVFVYRRWQALRAQRPRARDLVQFHADHKYLLMAHNQAGYRRLGRLVADAGNIKKSELLDSYIVELMQLLGRPATRKSHTNVLQHLAGYLKNALDSADRQELAELIDRYRLGQLPLVVPVTLLNHHFRRHPDPYIARQVYLNPHPAELMLRNHV